jgi:hypothetical protein
VRHLGAKAGSRHVAGIRLLGFNARRVQGESTHPVFFVYTPPSPTACAKSLSHLRRTLWLAINKVLAVSQPCTSPRSTCPFSRTSRPTAPSHFPVTPAASGRAINLRQDQQISIFLSMLRRTAITESQKPIITFFGTTVLQPNLPAALFTPTPSKSTQRSVKRRQDGA